jgi:hypothetical protein
MMDDANREPATLRERAGSLLGMVGAGFVLNIALIAWSVYQEYWWITAIAVVIGIAMLWQAWGAWHRRNGSGTRR